ncbi:hypothetical protein [Roseimicrobium sp. ORNL1]|uniref:XAC2610-related protein n=1 Tax=Roseimicrobium sp. ORNL1 TaxID=2711231 RepID=UPI0013E170F7|nr:hypothetical protein [Roseimicrobium sp. ORNL1]QIF00498.1 hypothetical protein G5S37_02825 [Roseimicrobium sp. ORNL1]
MSHLRTRLGVPLLAFLFSLVLPVLAEGKPSYPTKYAFKIRQATATLQFELKEGSLVDHLRLEFSNPRIPTQRIPCLDVIELNPSEVNPGFEADDYDGDGYCDFSLCDVSGTPSYVIRIYFLYSPTLRRFERCRMLDDAGVGHFDPKTRTFVGYRRSGPSKFAAEYRLEGGKLRLLRTVQEDCARQFRDILPKADEFDPYRVTTIYRADGTVRRFYRRVGQ